MSQKTASEQIDDIISRYGGWKGETIGQLRAIIKQAQPDIVEEIKWKMPSLPEGIPVWSYHGIVCIVQTFKDNIKLVFFKGVNLNDPNGLFNARLNSKTDRAIELKAGDPIDEAGIRDLVNQAAKLNAQKDNQSN